MPVAPVLVRLFLVGLFLVPTLGWAQKIEVGGALGGMLYKGDVSPTLNPRFVQPGGGLFFRYHPTRSFAVRIQATMGRLTAVDSLTTDPYQRARGASFRNTVREFAVLGEYKFRNYTPLRNVKNWTPYVFGGIGVFTHGLRQPGEGPVNMAFPLGVGFKYEFNRPWTLGLEWGTRFTFSDSLDGLKPPTAGTPRLNQSDPDTKDQYTFVAFTLSYTFYKVFCP